MGTYVVKDANGNTHEVEATYFCVEDGGFLTFYVKEEDKVIPRPAATFYRPISVKEKKTVDEHVSSIVGGRSLPVPVH
jgi:hypothetical protein